MRKRHLGLRITYRYLSGRPLTGALYTDCGYLRPGRKVLHPTGHASRWAHLPGWKRQAFRIGTPVLTVGWLIFHLIHPVITWIGTGTAVAALGITGYRPVAGRCRNWQRNRTVIRPMVAALTPYAELPADLIGKHLTLETDRVTVPLAPHHNGQAAKIADIRRIVQQRMGVEYDTELNMRTAPFYVRLTPVPAPPDDVGLADVIQDVYATTQDKPVLGLGARGEVVKLDFSGEIAHLASSIGTGGGKSSLLRFLLGQFSYHGIRDFEVIDVKQVSLEGMENLPGLRYHRTIDECWSALHRIREEMDRRYSIRLKNPTKTFPRKIVLLEEQNAFATLTKMAWKEQGGKGLAPVWNDITLILTMARQVNIIMIGMYQRMSAAVSGGGELRDQYGLKLLGRFSPQAWDSLVGTRPRGKASTIPGRVLAVMGESVRSVQLPFVTAEEAMALALSGAPVTCDSVENHEVSQPVTPVVTLPEPRYRLSEAATKDWCRVSHATLRQKVSRAKRAGRIPVDAKTFTEAELLELVEVTR